ncbi:MAG: NAD(P)-dependent oxidoreductase [Hyphomicrobium sp.]
MRVLVTGVSGFVGGALGSYMRADAGHRVVGLSRRAPCAGAADEFHAVDLAATIPDDLGRFDVVVHAAALASPFARPAVFQRNNVEATANILEFARRTRVPHFVFISSGSVFYAPGDQLGITETTPLPATPINAYAASKREAEALVNSSGLHALILRPRAVYGVGDTVLFPRILRASRAGVLPRFTRSDGSRAVGDLISIDNLVRFIAAAIEQRVAGDFNVTDGQPVDIYDFLETVLHKLGLSAPRWTIPAALAMSIAGIMETASSTILGWREPPLTRFGVTVLSQSKTFDISRARRVLGEPAVAASDVIDRYVVWQKAQWQR